MALRSMTGYGQGQAGEKLVVRVEVRSVNHRYADFAIRLPREYTFLEETIRGVLGSHVQRGRLEVSVSVEDLRDSPRTVKVDWGLLKGYDESISRIKAELDLGAFNRAEYLLSLPGVLQPMGIDDEEESLFQKLVQEATKMAAEALMEMSQAEGRRLEAVFKEYLADLGTSLDEIAKLAEAVPREYGERLEKRIQELIGDLEVDNQRLATEVAVLADRASIDEELVRLRSHIQEFHAILGHTGPVGRKLDFLLQEMNREVNTIGSKTTHITIARWVVEAKSIIEKLREQIQNVE